MKELVFTLWHIKQKGYQNMLDNKHSELAFQCFYCFAAGCTLCKPLAERFDENSADAWASSG